MSVSRLAAGVMAFLLIAAAKPASADDISVEELARSETGRAVLAELESRQEETGDLLIGIGSIVSPSGAEHDRAAAAAEAMRQAGLSDVRVTESPNVIGVLPGRSSEKSLIFVSTLDDLKTVAEHQRAADKPLQRQGERIVGPGSNTSLTTAAMIAAAGALVEAGFTPQYDIIFAGVAQEETGLVGMRALYEDYKDRAAGFVDILGDGETISYGALGIHWWRVEASGPPGHTLRGGLPNVNQGIARAVDRILSLPAASDGPRVTRLNVAILDSGSVFNHKPETGWFSLDIRSLDADRIAAIEQDVDSILAEVTNETGIEFTREAENIVPGGQIPGALDSPLVRWSASIARAEGLDPELNAAGSANLNVAIAQGTPAIGLGGDRGGERGHPGEWADISVLHGTARHVALLALAMGSGFEPGED